MSPIIRTRELTRHFGDFVAVDRLTIEVDAGSIFAFLGANGSGKSTTIGLVMAFYRPTAGRVLVEKLNMMKKHQRPTQKLRQGGIIERESPLALSNVLVVCGRCDKPVRNGIKALADGRKLRVCKRCGEPIDKG